MGALYSQQQAATIYEPPDADTPLSPYSAPTAPADEAHNVTMLLIDADDDVEVSLVSSRARSKAAASDKLYAAAAWTSCPARSASRASALRAQQLRPPST